MSSMNSRWTFFGCVFSALMLQAQPEPVVVEGIAATVGKNIILVSDWDQQIQSVGQQRQSMGEDAPSDCQVFEDMLFEKLLIHQAEIDSIEVGEDEVESTIDRRIAMLTEQIGSQRKMEEYYNKSTVEIKEEMRELVQDQLLAQRMQATITEGAEVTPSQVRKFYKDIPEDSLPLINTEVVVQQIVRYPKVTADAKRSAIEKLNGFRERVEGGSSFSTLAILYSEDPGSAKNGGEYKAIQRGQFVKEFEAIAFNLQAGEVSEPFETEYGYHIIQLIEKRGEELDLRHILVKPKISDADLNAARGTLDSLKAQIIKGSISFDDAAFQFSEDEDTRFNNGLLINPQSGDSKWDISQLDRSLFYAIEDMDPGEISKSSLMRSRDGKEAFRLVLLVDRTQPHRANLKEDYSRLQMMATMQRKQEVVEEWVAEKIRETAVKISADLVPCSFHYDWVRNEQD